MTSRGWVAFSNHFSLVDFTFEPSIAQTEDTIEAVKNLVVMRNGNNGGILVNGHFAKQVHDNTGAV